MSIEAHLEINPPDILEFSLSTEEATPKVILTLNHPDADNDTPIAFKVKTTQPRRYLVRPNQGLIAPGKEEKVTILLVEKDKNSLLKQYESLGPAALETCKDKFLVQSVAVSAEQAESLTEYDQLTALWTNIQSVAAPPTDPTNPNATATTHPKAATANKKLHVQHKVIGSASQTNNDNNNVTSTGAPAAPAPARPIAHPERLSKEQLIVELTHLRKKYDELVGFSVNLTAERDVLNNTLEQTKRDLNRELNQSSSSVSGGGNSNIRGRSANVATTGGSNFVTLLIYIVTALLMGAKLQQMGFLHGLPGLTFHHRNHHDDEL